MTVRSDASSSPDVLSCMPDDLIFRIFIEPLGSRALQALWTCKKLSKIFCEHTVIADAIKRCKGLVCTHVKDTKKALRMCREEHCTVHEPRRAADARILRRILKDPIVYINQRAVTIDGVGGFHANGVASSADVVRDRSAVRSLVDNGIAAFLYELTMRTTRNGDFTTLRHLKDSFPNVHTLRIRNKSFVISGDGDVLVHGLSALSWKTISVNFLRVLHLDLIQCNMTEKSLAHLMESSLITRIEVLTLEQHVHYIGACMQRSLRARPEALCKLHTLNILGSKHHEAFESAFVRHCLALRSIRRITLIRVDFPFVDQAASLFRQPFMPVGVLESLRVLHCDERTRASLHALLHPPCPFFSCLKFVQGIGPASDFSSLT